MATDLVGRPIVVGSRVAYCMAGQSSNMRAGIVEKVGPATVQMQQRNEWGGIIRRNHKAVCLIE